MGTLDVRLLAICVVAAVLLAGSSVAVVGAAWSLTARRRGRGTLRRARNLTPEMVIEYRCSEPAEEPPYLLSRRIVERSEQIRRALSGDPSETEIQLCALGYCACADDLLKLVGLVSERYPGSGPLRQLRASVAVRRATDSLSRTRRAFPPNGPVGAPVREAGDDAGQP